jgi:hypothetical protein
MTEAEIARLERLLSGPSGGPFVSSVTLDASVLASLLADSRALAEAVGLLRRIDKAPHGGMTGAAIVDARDVDDVHAFLARTETKP